MTRSSSSSAAAFPATTATTKAGSRTVPNRANPLSSISTSTFWNRWTSAPRKSSQQRRRKRRATLCFLSSTAVVSAVLVATHLVFYQFMQSLRVGQYDNSQSIIVDALTQPEQPSATTHAFDTDENPSETTNSEDRMHPSNNLVAAGSSTRLSNSTYTKELDHSDFLDSRWSNAMSRIDNVAQRFLPSSTHRQLRDSETAFPQPLTGNETCSCQNPHAKVSLKNSQRTRYLPFHSARLTYMVFSQSPFATYRLSFPHSHLVVHGPFVALTKWVMF